MPNLSKPKSGKFLATIFALSSIGMVVATAEKAAAVPLYPNALSNNQVYRLQMEQNASNGSPVTLNITPSYGQKNNGRFNTWMGVDNDSLFVYLTNGSGINFQNSSGRYYSINVPTLDIRPGISLNTYQSGFSRYQDWNIEKVASSYNDTYLFRWRTDTNTNLCLDIGQGLRVNDQVPTLQYCNQNSASQRIRVIKQGQNSAPVNNPTPPAPSFTSPQGNSLVNNNAMLPGTSIKSTNQCFSLESQHNGNLVLYKQSNRQALFTFTNNTGERSVKHTVFQNNGALAAYDYNNNPIWQTRVFAGATRFTVEDNGNFVIYNAQNQIIAHTNTAQSQPCKNTPTPPSNNGYILPFQAGYQARVDQAWGAKTVSGTGNTHGPTPLAIDFTVFATEYTASGGLYYSAAQARAIAAGQVIQASYQGVYGNTVIIRHDDGNTSQYSHLHNYAVQNGQRVSAGQNLGAIGMTASNAPIGKNNVHLHFEMKDRNGKYITFQFIDAAGINFSQPGITVTAKNP